MSDIEKLILNLQVINLEPVPHDVGLDQIKRVGKTTTNIQSLAVSDPVSHRSASGGAGCRLSDHQHVASIYTAISKAISSDEAFIDTMTQCENHFKCSQTRFCEFWEGRLYSPNR